MRENMSHEGKVTGKQKDLQIWEVGRKKLPFKTELKELKARDNVHFKSSSKHKICFSQGAVSISKSTLIT